MCTGQKPLIIKRRNREHILKCKSKEKFLPAKYMHVHFKLRKLWYNLCLCFPTCSYSIRCRWLYYLNVLSKHSNPRIGMLPFSISLFWFPWRFSPSTDWFRCCLATYQALFYIQLSSLFLICLQVLHLYFSWEFLLSLPKLFFLVHTFCWDFIAGTCSVVLLTSWYAS